MRMIGIVSIVFLLMNLAPARGSSIVSTFCRVVSPGGDVTDASSSSGCTLGPIYGDSSLPLAYAQASAAYDFSSGFQADAFASTYTNLEPPDDPPDPSLQTNALGSAELNLTVTTLGPVRPGLLDLMFQGLVSIDPGVSDGYAEGSVGTLFVTAGVSGFGCTGPCDGTFPFTLGQPFNIHLAAFSQSFVASGFGPGMRDAYMGVSFQLRELDGTAAPVAVVPIPEPSTLLLLAPGLLLIAWRRLVVR